MATPPNWNIPGSKGRKRTPNRWQRVLGAWQMISHELLIEGAVIRVHRLITRGDRWFVTCAEHGITNHELAALKMQDARIEALQYVTKQSRQNPNRSD